MASKTDKLKRQSGGKPEQLRLDDFVLYLDENLDNCNPILAALTDHEVRFERHRDHFPRGTEDHIWLPYTGERGWIVLTKDKRNRYNQLEREVLKRSNVREFYFGSGNFSGPEMAEALVCALPALRRIYAAYSPPLVVSITRSGAVTVVLDELGATHERRTKANRQRI